MRRMSEVAVLVLAAAGMASAAAPTKAVAVLRPTQGSTAEGKATFTHTEKGMNVSVHLTGLTPGKHAFQIHEWGDCSAPDGASAGGHFNPGGEPHAGPTDAHRHTGDMGNLEANASGVADLEYTDARATFEGANSILGHGAPRSRRRGRLHDPAHRKRGGPPRVRHRWRREGRLGRYGFHARALGADRHPRRAGDQHVRPGRGPPGRSALARRLERRLDLAEQELVALRPRLDRLGNIIDDVSHLTEGAATHLPRVITALEGGIEQIRGLASLGAFFLAKPCVPWVPRSPCGRDSAVRRGRIGSFAPPGSLRRQPRFPEADLGGLAPPLPDVARGEGLKRSRWLRGARARIAASRGARNDRQSGG